MLPSHHTENKTYATGTLASRLGSAVVGIQAYMGGNLTPFYTSSKYFGPPARSIMAFTVAVMLVFLRQEKVQGLLLDLVLCTVPVISNFR